MTDIKPIFNHNNFDDVDAIDNLLIASSTEPIFDKKIDIFCEKRGSKSNTYIAGWLISKEEMKVHLKKLQKECACNGSVKTILYDNSNIMVLHLQGNHVSIVANYLKTIGPQMLALFLVVYFHYIFSFQCLPMLMQCFLFPALSLAFHWYFLL